MCQLLEALRSNGYKAASLKHHGHGETRPLVNPAADTGKHFLSGALITALASPYQTIMDFRDEPPLEAYIAFYKKMNIDVLLIEGFKKAPYPKAVLLRSTEDLSLLKELDNIQAVIAPQGVDVSRVTARVFEREKTDDFTSFILKWMEAEV